jgi:predicted nucleic acid-binding protein
VIRGVLADAGPLYAAADESDAHHQRAHRESQALEKDRRQIVIAYPTLLETHALVLNRMGPRAAFLWLGYMSDSVLINPSPEDYQQALMRVHALPDQRITLFDATIAAVAANLGLEVWTYNHHFDVMRVPVWRM